MQTTTTMTTMITTTIRVAVTAALTAFLTTPAQAVTVAECDWRASAQAIVEPWDVFSRTFANGDVRITLTDTIEPAAGALHLVILSPPLDELGGRQCKVVSADGSSGFAGVLFEDMTSDYNPTTGLRLTMDVQVFNATTDTFQPRSLAVTINQASGAVDARLLGGK
ncbi:MAG: hypothetical protein AAF739_09415 [Pseudomonadota bacterium]